MSFLELVAIERYYGKSRMSGDIKVKRLEEFLLLTTIDTFMSLSYQQVAINKISLLYVRLC